MAAGGHRYQTDKQISAVIVISLGKEGVSVIERDSPSISGFSTSGFFIPLLADDGCRVLNQVFPAGGRENGAFLVGGLSATCSDIELRACYLQIPKLLMGCDFELPSCDPRTQLPLCSWPLTAFQPIWGTSGNSSESLYLVTLASLSQSLDGKDDPSLLAT